MYSRCYCNVARNSFSPRGGYGLTGSKQVLQPSQCLVNLVCCHLEEERKHDVRTYFRKKSRRFSYVRFRMYFETTYISSIVHNFFSQLNAAECASLYQRNITRRLPLYVVHLLWWDFKQVFLIMHANVPPSISIKLRYVLAHVTPSISDLSPLPVIVQNISRSVNFLLLESLNTRVSFNYSLESIRCSRCTISLHYI